ncbi:MAG: RdgB/HAM1 family non-canonical purine NTP pyrophosphatase [Erysipelotrichaceae bacterium]|nr:RdgB/HAM1 family non-canonical purine NTP pyrophosphatase [Erysipelotrichaceae bacterium]MBR4122314.1 RdgB/HAM1 family non-canonical purine NTP pyrophosphatase [Erysipelotrichaceae bacterium]
MKKILLASTNKNKVREIREMLKGSYEVLSLQDLDCDVDVKENAYTFLENASLKARAYYDLTGIPVIADDSGLSIAYFNELPGVHSARFYKDYDYFQRNTKILEIMKDIKDRTAHYTCAMVYYDGKEEQCFVGEVYGEIAHEIAGTNGFGYDPIFYYPPMKKTFAEISAEEKHKVSHRGIALRKLVAHLEA